ncbi:energy-coupling factor transporter transmembrane component T family protein [Thermococcus profundus]|nr:energy-coupling factor transporter transmembrane component T [Thermococcus profundus]
MRGLLLVLGFLLIGMWLMEVEFGVLLDGLKVVLPFIAIAVVLRLTFGVGSSSTPTGSLEYFLRLLLMFLPFLILAETSKPSELRDLLLNLGFPLWLVISVFLLMKNVEAGKRILREVKIAQTSRGMDFNRGNFVARLWNSKTLVIPLVAWGLVRSGDLSRSLEARGFSLEKKPTTLTDGGIGGKDILTMGVMLLILAIALKL